jgi:DNA-directed RNA polymerase subunit alpha
MTNPDTPLLELLAAADFGPRQAVRLRRQLSVTPELRKELRDLLAGFDQNLAPHLPQDDTAVRQGAFHWAMGEDEEAEKLLNHRRHAALACYLMGEIRMERGSLKEAADIFEQSASLSKDSTIDRCRQAECLLELGREEDALAVLDKAAKKSPDASEVSYVRGLLAEREGDQQKALDLYEAALTGEPAHPGANFRSAWLLDLRGLDEEAAQRYKSVAGESSLYASALTNLGLLHDENGRFDEAIACFEQALKLQPTNERLRLYLSDAVASTEMYYDEAQEKEQERMEMLLRTPLNDFELSVRSRNCLARLGVKSLADIIKHTEEDLLAHKNFGETSLQEIKDLLNSKALYLGLGRDEERRRRQRARMGPNSDNPVLSRPIAELGLSVRGRSCMQRLGIVSIGDLVAHTEKELLSVKNFGQTSLREVHAKLSEANLSFKAEK